MTGWHRGLRKAIETLHYAFSRSALLLLQNLPYVVALRIAEMLAATAYAIRLRRDVIRGNLLVAFGNEVDESDRQRIASEVYGHWVRTLMADIPHLSPRQLEQLC